jgi:hypothetical protein
MSGSYDDSKYGVIERHWFDQRSGLLAADNELVQRLYPRGPIYIKKFGVRHLATQGGTESTINFLLDGSVTLATVIASTDSSPWAIASKSVGHKCSAASYLSVTNTGTVATGTVQCFMDYVRYYSHTGDWDHV